MYQDPTPASLDVSDVAIDDRNNVFTTHSPNLDPALSYVQRLTPGTGDLEGLLMERGLPFVEYAGWEAIDEHERARGEEQGRPRVKLASWEMLLARARQLQPRG